MKAIIFWMSCISAIFAISCAAPNQNNGTKEKEIAAERASSNWELLDTGTQCAIQSARQVLVKSEQDYITLWNEAFEGIDMAPERPEVDFSQKWVIAGFLGTVNNGGHEISIHSIREGANPVAISFLHTAPGKDCMSTMAIEFPYIFVSIDHLSTEKVTFQTQEEQKDCN